MSTTSDNNATCESVRELAFDYRRGDLDEEASERFERHLSDCEACRDYAQRLDIVIGAARDHEVSPEPADPDAMFDSIVGQIDKKEKEQEKQAGDEGPDRPDEDTSDETRHRGSGTTAIVAAAAAVGLIIGSIVTVLWQSDAGAPADTVAEKHKDEAERTEQKGPSEGEDTEKTTDEDRTGFAELQRVSTSANKSDTSSKLPENLRLFASTEADWSLQIEGAGNNHLTLDLDRGEMLVEFVPRGDQTLAVDAPGYRVRVVGTVFYVSARENTDKNPGVAGVLEGEVEVENDEGRTVHLEREEEVTGSYKRRPMDRERRRVLSKYVDLEAHRQSLADAKAAMAERTEKAAKTPPKQIRKVEKTKENRPEEPKLDPPDESTGVGTAEKRPTGGTKTPEQSNKDPLEQLRRRADQAASRGKHREAERRYREFLQRAPADHPAVGPVHLDLANLYIHQLGQPTKAVEHLETFVTRWPGDVAAPSARRTLCRLTRKLEEFEPRCP